MTAEHAPAGLHGPAAPYDQAGQHGQAAGRRPVGMVDTGNMGGRMARPATPPIRPA